MINCASSPPGASLRRLRIFRILHESDPFPPELLRDVKKRRTFAIISHPDAGKTTLTEKLLLYGGAIQMAGTVKARKSSRHATSDWMEVEKQRGISVTSSVMQFEYEGNTINLLDTPGHEDFSEDTYRVLTAVDAAVMVIDAAKGVEAQTIKLLEVCRLRDTPIITFVNKFDREVREPFELLSEIEDVLKIECAPITWPLGMGKAFRGCSISLGISSCASPRARKNAAPPRSSRGSTTRCSTASSRERSSNCATMWTSSRGQRAVRSRGLPGRQADAGVLRLGHQQLRRAGDPQRTRRVGAAAAAARRGRRMVEPAEAPFTGFVFKIQANMDPKHRDRIAFFRICSGRYSSGMKVRHVRLGREMKLANALTFMANERVHKEDGVAGDIIGIHNHGQLQIGDTLTEGETLGFKGIPYFRRSSSVRRGCAIPSKAKQLQKGLQELGEEGAIQVFEAIGGNMLLGAVGQLQFEVVAQRLRTNTRSTRSSSRPRSTPRAGSLFRTS